MFEIWLQKSNVDLFYLGLHMAVLLDVFWSISSQQLINRQVTMNERELRRIWFLSAFLRPRIVEMS